MYQTIYAIFEQIVQYAILLTEFAGVSVLIYTIIRAIVSLILGKKSMRLDLVQGIALALEFKLGGEVLRTVIVREWSELMILGAVIVLRAALTLLINWEIKKEEERIHA
jgi:uncharacterized membrane protein